MKELNLSEWFVCVSHHVWLLSWLALGAGLAGVAGLVEEFILSAAGILCTGKHATHLEGDGNEEKEDR